MSNEAKATFLTELERRYGTFKKLPQSQSLYELHPSRTRVYVRYSKLHKLNQTFYGLRDIDLRQLEGHPSLICFLWEGQSEPLFVPFDAYEQVFLTTRPAKDGQYKAQIYLQEGGIDLYFPKAGRFNVEGNFGWGQLDRLTQGVRSDIPNLSHAQVQTLLGAIGAAKGHDIWLPSYDRSTLDWTIADKFVYREVPPYGFHSVAHILQEVDSYLAAKGLKPTKSAF